MQETQKLCAYVDESGQDDTSKFFIVVAVTTSENQDDMRRQLLNIEELAKTNGMKWHKTRHDRRIRYVTVLLQRKIAAGAVYFGRYQKPLPYFFPMLDVLEHAIKSSVRHRYRASVYVDGIDKSIAKKLTNALRARRVSLRLVRGKREESEPLIRLADMWAGCIRGALLGGEESKKLFEQGKKSGYLQEVTT